jgi:hypothetical protein
MARGGGSDGRLWGALDGTRDKQLDERRGYLAERGVDAAAADPPVAPAGLGMSGWGGHHVPVGGAVVDVVQDADLVGQPGWDDVQVPAAGAGADPWSADRWLGVVGKEAFQAVTALWPVNVDDVEDDAAAQADVGVWPALPPGADLVWVGGRVVYASAALTLGDARQLAGQRQHRDAAACVLQRPGGKAVTGASHARRSVGGRLTDLGRARVEVPAARAGRTR